MNKLNKSMHCTLSTCLTIGRFFLTPFIVYAMATSAWKIAFLLFITAAFTDILDGFLARILRQETFLGALLDPLADKVLLISCFTTLACTHTLPFSIPSWFIYLLLVRETLIIGGFIYLFIKNKTITIEPTRLGKLTTVAHSLFIIWLFSCYFFNWIPVKTYYAVLGIISCLVIVSLVQYARIAFNFYRKNCS